LRRFSNTDIKDWMLSLINPSLGLKKTKIFRDPEVGPWIAKSLQEEDRLFFQPQT
jgi:hypothetical protein